MAAAPVKTIQTKEKSLHNLYFGKFSTISTIYVYPPMTVNNLWFAEQE